MTKRNSTMTFMLTIGALLLAFAPRSFAQSQSQPAAQPTGITNLYSVRVTRVKPEMAAEYNTFTQNETIPAYKKGGVKLRNTLTTATFGDVGEYVSVEPVASLKQFDEQGALRKALGEEGYRTWGAKWMRLIASSHNYIVQLRPDLSVNMPKAGTPPTKLAMMAAVTIAPGRQAEYESFLKSDLMPILQKAYPKGVLVSRILLGGNGNEYRVLVPLDSFADLESGMLAAMREGFQKVQSKNAGIVLHSESSILRYVPELSIGPGARTAENK